MSKFYQLEPDEWLTVCKELKPAEVKVLYRLRTLDPFGQHPIKFRVIDLAKDLDMNKGTVSRAIQRIAELGYINLEIVEAIATLTTKSKRLRTDNQVVSTQPTHINIGCVQTTKLCTDNLVDRYTTSAIATQPDSLESGSGRSTVFSKISLDQLDRSRSDRSEDFSNFSNSENSEKLQGLTAIASITKPIVKIDDFKTVKADELAETPVKAIAPIEGDSRRRRVEDFILKTLDANPNNRAAYFSKFTPKNWQSWEDRLTASLNLPTPKNFVRTEDPYIIENAIRSMAQCKDFDAIADRLAELEKTNPTLATQLQEKYL